MTSHIVSDKRALRRRMRQRRDNFHANLSAFSRAASFRLWPTYALPLLRPGLTVAGYVANGSEADPGRLLGEAQNRGCRLALPFHTSRSAIMEFRLWSPGEALQTGPFGTAQPLPDAPRIDPNVMLCPMLAFDRRGTRLGQGGGHYDRAIAAMTSSPVKVGLAWAIQESDVMVSEMHDQRMDAILTEQEFIMVEDIVEPSE